MCDSRKNCALGCFVALEVVGADHARPGGQALEQRANELFRGPLVPPTLDHHLQDVPLLLHRPPQIEMLPLARHKHLLQVPLVPRPGTAATEVVSLRLAVLAAPFPHRFRGHAHAAVKSYFFPSAKAQAEAKVQPHGVAKELDRTPLILVFRGSGTYIHPTTLSHLARVPQVDHACRMQETTIPVPLGFARVPD